MSGRGRFGGPPRELGAGTSGRRPGGAWSKGRGRGGRRGGAQVEGGRARRTARISSAAARENREAGERFDENWGYARVEEGPERVGYMVNVKNCTVTDEDGVEWSGVDVHMLEQSGETFKVTLRHAPYFYVGCQERWTREVGALLERKFEGLILRVERCEKEDLDLANHLSGRKAVFLKLSFRTVGELMDVRRELRSLIEKNQATMKEAAALTGGVGGEMLGMETEEVPENFEDVLMDIREYDVPYMTRVAIDCEVRVGAWYRVRPMGTQSQLERLEDMVVKAEPRILAFDIECTKAPLKFPDAATDQIYMISYMLDSQGYLLINRAVVADDIEDFEYTPKREFPGPFRVENWPDEKAMIERFFQHCEEVRPTVYVTYNGDFFDWPFLENRARAHGMNMAERIGVSDMGTGEYKGRTASHIDCFYWVKRDSYLPQGSQSLKAVTRYKLGYDPVEIDPEDMLRMAVERPKHMASYSVSDAVATYYLYMKYVHNFIFSLCTIIPLPADDVLRKGSGTLCELLLMVEATRNNVICPNKQVEDRDRTYKGHLLESETYVGGHVESLESGVFRSDLPARFRLDPSAFQELIDRVDASLTFALEVENGVERADVLNYDEVRAQIVEKLEALRDRPVREETPFIYHLDVAAMYPNIILTNRLQPSAMVTPADCAACDFNTPDDSNRCKRHLEWVWRGNYFPPTRAETEGVVRHQLLNESVEHPDTGEKVPVTSLPRSMQHDLLLKRLKTYSQRVYKRVKDTEEEQRVSTVCQRENAFYIDTVRAFRDRRYEFKGLTKKWSKATAAAEKAGDKLAAVEAKSRTAYFDSLQLAHKCILNSFYGYVMRRGSRWHSMEMAGVVTHTGARLITQARELVERIGRPLELDTDGIWCILPSSFPEDFTFKLRSSSKPLTISYPCVMLNVDVHDRYTNHQYQTLLPGGGQRYSTRSECSIFFEVDGPYRCMVLPASQEEGRLLKKRYAVFNPDGSLAELKGFELKRRGELKMVKDFQSQVFQRFLHGRSLDQCYASVASVAEYWLDILDSRGEDLDDDELIDLISENRSMSRTLDDYGDQKSTALTTARRLAEFLGAEMVKDKGLACKLLIACKPAGAPVTDRAIPTAIFSAEPSIRRHYLRKWCRSAEDLDLRSIVDWDYYRQRLGATIQKIITIPAALQDVPNPVPRVEHPEWLTRLARQRADPRRQTALTSFFNTRTADDATSQIPDLEDMMTLTSPAAAAAHPHAGVSRTRIRRPGDDDEEEETAKKEYFEGEDDEEERETAKKQVDFEEEEEDEEDEERPVRVERQSWLSRRKRKWATVRERVASSGGGGGAGGASMAEEGTLSSFVADATSALAGRRMHVVEIRETSRPGVLEAWAFAGTAGDDGLQLTRFWIRVPRKVFVHRRSALEGHERLEVERTLPHGKPRMHLYEIVRSEEEWQRRADGDATLLRDLLADPEVEGVYETGVTPLLRALLSVGCVSKVSAAALHRRLANGGADAMTFDLDELEFASVESEPYLHLPLAKARLASLYHLMVGAASPLGIVCLLVQRDTPIEALRMFARAGEDMDSATGRRAAEDKERSLISSGAVAGVDFPVRVTAHVIFVNSRTSADAGSRPNLRRVLAAATESVGTHPANEVKFQAAEAPSLALAWQGAQSVLAEYARRHIPLLVSTMSPLPREALVRSMPSLESFPLLECAFHAEDASLPLQWREHVARCALQRGLATMLEWPQRVATAEYCNTPVGNLSTTPHSGLLDLVFARNLEYNGHLLWVSRSLAPDLGRPEAPAPLVLRPLPVFSWTEGFSSAAVKRSSTLAAERAPFEDASFAVDTIRGTGDAAGGAAASVDHAGAHVAKVSRPGVFRRVCVHLSVAHLAINTLLCAHQLFESGAANVDAATALDLADDHPAAAAAIADLIPCAAALRVLRRCAAAWAADLAAGGHRAAIARPLLRRLYQWLASPASDLHDPALHHAVRELMTRVWEQLVAHIRRSGGTVVFATFTDIVVATPKLAPAAAKGWTAFLHDSIISKPLFERLELRALRWYHRLVWLDDANFAGYLLPNTPEQQPFSDDLYHAHWNVAEYLPAKGALLFEGALMEFLGRPARKAARTRSRREQQSAASSSSSAEAAGSAATDEASEAQHEAELSKAAIESKLGRRIVKEIENLRRLAPEDAEFPQGPGSFLRLDDPALETSKALCHVLALDPAVADAVSGLRQSLLRVCRTPDFTPAARWQNPCLTFVLPDVICTHCLHSRDLDICRDAFVRDHVLDDPASSSTTSKTPHTLHTPPHPSSSSPAKHAKGGTPGDAALHSNDDNTHKTRMWFCPRCLNPYNGAKIENALVEWVQARSAGYQTQDLFCSKSRAVRSDKLSFSSPLSGKWINAESPERFGASMRVFERIANYHQFDWLQDTVKWLVQPPSSLEF